MNVFRSISLATRKLSILLAIIVLVSLSLFLYYFKYIPANKERLQHQGFLILRQQQSGIQQNLEDLKNYFCVQKQLFIEERNKGKNKSNFFYKEYKDRPLNYNLKYKKGEDSTAAEADLCDPSVSFDLDTIAFRFSSAADSIDFKIPLDQLFEKVLDPVRAHFFQYHFIVCKQHLKAPEENNATRSLRYEGDSLEKKPHILYSSHGLAVSEEMEPDSLGKMLASSQFSKIIDLEMSGSSYKAFMLPFQLGHNTLILTGLMPGIEYRQRLQNIPFSTVNTIIIVFIFILISLPYVKVFFISPEEHFGIRDIVLLGFTLFAGTAIFLIILQQGLMQTGARLRTRDYLDSLSYRINQRFRNDISHAYTELKYLDSTLAVLKCPDTTLKEPKTNKVLFEKDSIKKRLFVKEAATDSGYLLPFPKTNSFLSYIVAHWADSTGQQVYKGLFSDKLHSFSDISNRQYFKDVRSNHLYSFTNKANDLFSYKKIASFTIQPVYSMSTNSFEVNIAVPGKAATMAALSARINSVMNTILPRGYGFYIVDNKGLIQFQSEGVVTLQENFLEWINDKQNLINTIKNRQTRYVADQYIDDRQFSLFIRPIDQLPLHLVVYHCNDFTTASILHINAFILFFLFILLAMLLVFCFVAWNKTNHFSKLNQPIYQYDWIIPAHNKSRFFINANCYLLGYIFFTVIYSVFVHRNSTIWFIGVVSPIFTVWTLYILFRLHIHLKGVLSLEGIPRSLFRFLLQPYNLIAFTFLLFLNIIYFRIQANPAVIRSLLFYEIISLLLIPTVILFSPVYDKLVENGSFSKLSKAKMPLYNFFWFLSVVAISIIPVSCFFIYAQQKENNMLIKAQQLDMAENIENRLSKFDWFDDVVKKKDVSYKQKDEFFFNYGVYDDSCISVKTDTTAFSVPGVSEPYDEVIRAISWRYRSLDKILPGQDAATDKKWYRDDSLKLHPALMKLVYKLSPENKKADSISNVNSLEIKCTAASIFEYYRINNLTSILVVVLFSILLLIMFFRLIRIVTGRLFHTWNFKGEETISSHKRNMVRNQLIKKEYDEYNGIDKVLKRKVDDPDKKYKCLKYVWKREYLHNDYDKTNLSDQEDEILYNQYHLSALYENLWNLCSKEEKYFLYDMARDGFVNYKRAHLVQQLLYKGLLINYNKEELKIMSVSFRNYILDKGKSEEVIKLKEEFNVQGTWSKLRTPVLIAITAIGTFLFITQQDMFQRVAALIPTLSALLGLGTLILGSKVKQGST
jgi:hypothetical protein